MLESDSLIAESNQLWLGLPNIFYSRGNSNNYVDGVWDELISD